MVKKTVLACLGLFLILSISCCVMRNENGLSKESVAIDCAKTEAKKELGENCKLVTCEFNEKENMFAIGFTNEDDSHAIMFLVTYKENGTCDVKEFFSRIGAPASEVLKQW